MIPPFVCADEYLNNDEIQKVEEYCSKFELEKGQASSNYGDAGRNTDIVWIMNNNETEWLYSKFYNLINDINKHFYQFNIIGFPAIQYGVYDSKKEGKSDWHMDLQISKNIYLDNEKTRKLSVAILLSQPGVDFEGGEFEISSSFSERKGVEETKLTKGSAIIFPSFMVHRVKPVTKGIRKSLVVWAEGPRFI